LRDRDALVLPEHTESDGDDRTSVCSCRSMAESTSLAPASSVPRRSECADSTDGVATEKPPASSETRRPAAECTPRASYSAMDAQPSPSTLTAD
jgi:hypothetical protein